MSALARAHRVCAYDRPGTLRYTEPPSVTERSSPVSMPRTAQDVVGDLHALLTAADVPGPYVLVAHSLGGLFGRLYAQTYPDQVRALLFVDSFPVEIPTLMGADWPAYRQLLNSPLPLLANTPTFEVVDIDKSIAQMAAPRPFPPIPTAVLTKTEPFPIPSTAPPEVSGRGSVGIPFWGPGRWGDGTTRMRERRDYRRLAVHRRGQAQPARLLRSREVRWPRSR